jgi:hypothetical protein
MDPIVSGKWANSLEKSHISDPIRIAIIIAGTLLFIYREERRRRQVKDLRRQVERLKGRKRRQRVKKHRQGVQLIFSTSVQALTFRSTMLFTQRATRSSRTSVP